MSGHSHCTDQTPALALPPQSPQGEGEGCRKLRGHLLLGGGGGGKKKRDNIILLHIYFMI